VRFVYALGKCPSRDLCVFHVSLRLAHGRHGPVSHCSVEHSEKLVQEYLALPVDSPGRTEMERRYGRKKVQSLVVKFEQERLDMEWIRASTTSCPGCKVNIHKSKGCNHVCLGKCFRPRAKHIFEQMTCSKCQHHFCYRCEMFLFYSLFTVRSC
jgi:E3 ubiquitin-protein ligase RNF14